MVESGEVVMMVPSIFKRLSFFSALSATSADGISRLPANRHARKASRCVFPMRLLQCTVLSRYYRHLHDGELRKLRQYLPIGDGISQWLKPPGWTRQLEERALAK